MPAMSKRHLCPPPFYTSFNPRRPSSLLLAPSLLPSQSLREGLMMFFVFDVDKATRYALSINLHALSVRALQNAITETYNVPDSNQIIMVSGGVKLNDPSAQLEQFGAGTDSNPAFLFRREKKIDDKPSLPIVNPHSAKVTDLRMRISDLCRRSPQSYHISMCNVLHELGLATSKLHRDVAAVVADQEFQQQGWFTLLAHLQDSLKSIEKTFDIYKEKFAEFVKNEKEHTELLCSVPAVLAVLDKLPVSFRIFECVQRLDVTASRMTVARGSGRRSRTTSETSVTSTPGLTTGAGEKKTGKESPQLQHQQHHQAFIGKEGAGAGAISKKEVAVVTSGSSSGGGGATGTCRKKRESDSEMSVMFEFEEDMREEDGEYEKSLLQFINESSIKDVQFFTDACNHSLNSMSASTYRHSVEEYSMLLSSCRSPERTVVPSLSQRMQALQQLQETTRQDGERMRHQCERLQASKFDASHPKVLQDVHESLMRLTDQFETISTRYDQVNTSKREVTENIFHYTSIVIDLLDKLHSAHSHMTLVIGNLEQTVKYLNIVRTVVNTPRLFCLSIAEINRRKTYSTTFKRWADPLVHQVSALHMAEVERRSAYRRQLDLHFLTSLFPGLLENPPSQWAKRPRDFDVNVPQLSREYLSRLAAAAPQFADLLLRDPVVDAVPQLLHHLPAFSAAGAVTVTAAAAVVCAAQHTRSMGGCGGGTTSLSVSSLALDTTLSSSSASIEVFASAVTTSPAPTTSGVSTAGCAGGADPARSGGLAAAGAVSVAGGGGAMAGSAAGRDHHESETDTEEFEKVGRSEALDYQAEAIEAEVMHIQPASSPDSLNTQEYLTAEFDVPDDSELTMQQATTTTTTTSTTTLFLTTSTKTVTTAAVVDSSGSKSKEDLSKTLQLESDMQQLVRHLQQQLSQLKVQLATVKEEVSGAAAEHLASIASATSAISAAVGNFAARCDRSASESRQQVDEVTHYRLLDLENEVEIYHRQIVELRGQLENKESEHQEQVHNLTEDYTSRTRALVEKHAAEQLLQNTSHDSQLRLLTEAHEKQLAKLSLEHEMEGLRWEDEWKLKYSGESEQLAQEVCQLEQQLQARTAELEELKREQRVRAVVLEEQYRVRESKALEEQSRQLEKSFEEKMHAAKYTHAEEISAISRELSTLKVDHANHLDALACRHLEDLSKLSSEHDATVATRDQRILELQAQLERVHVEYRERLEDDRGRFAAEAETRVRRAQEESEALLRKERKDREVLESKMAEAQETWRLEKIDIEEKERRRQEEMHKTLMEEKRSALEALKGRFQRITSAALEKSERVSSPDDELSRLRDELAKRQQQAVQEALEEQRAEAAEQQRIFEAEVQDRLSRTFDERLRNELEKKWDTEKEEHVLRVEEEQRRRCDEKLLYNLEIEKNRLEAEISDKLKQLYESEMADRLNNLKKKHAAEVKQELEALRQTNESQTQELIKRYKAVEEEKETEFDELLLQKQQLWHSEKNMLQEDLHNLVCEHAKALELLEKVHSEELTALRLAFDTETKSIERRHAIDLAQEAEQSALGAVWAVCEGASIEGVCASSLTVPDASVVAVASGVGQVSPKVQEALQLAVTKLKQSRATLVREKDEEMEDVRRRALEEKRDDRRQLEIKMEEEKKKAVAESKAEVSRLLRQVGLDKERVLEERDMRITLVEDENSRLRSLVGDVERYRKEVAILRRELFEHQQREASSPALSQAPSPPHYSPFSPSGSPGTHTSPGTHGSPGGHGSPSIHGSPVFGEKMVGRLQSPAGDAFEPPSTLDVAATTSALDTSFTVSALKPPLAPAVVPPCPPPEMVASFTVAPSTSTSTAKALVSHSPAKRGPSLLVQVGSCQPGDICLVGWDMHHCQYRLLLQHSILHFLHSDCYGELGLHELEAGATPLPAQVLLKEFCVAKKEGNRFRVPTDTKFYRVHVRLPECIKKHSLVPETHPSFTPAASVLQYLKTVQPAPLMFADIELKDLLSRQRLQLEFLRRHIETMEASGAGALSCSVRKGDSASKLRKRKTKKRESVKESATPEGTTADSSEQAKENVACITEHERASTRRGDGSENVNKERSRELYLDAQACAPKSIQVVKSLSEEFSQLQVGLRLEVQVEDEDVDDQTEEELSRTLDNVKRDSQMIEVVVADQPPNISEDETKWPETTLSKDSPVCILPSIAEVQLTSGSTPGITEAAVTEQSGGPDVGDSTSEEVTTAKQTPVDVALATAAVTEGTALLSAAPDVPGDASSAEEADESSVVCTKSGGEGQSEAVQEREPGNVTEETVGDDSKQTQPDLT